MKVLSDDEAFYSLAELQEIDGLINANMETHLHHLIQSRIDTLMRAEMINYSPPLLTPSPQSIEQGVCNLLNHLHQQWNQKQEDLQQAINCHMRENQQLAATVLHKEQQIHKCLDQIRAKDAMLTQMVKQKHSLDSIVFILKQQLATEKSNFISYQSAKEKQLQQQSMQLQKLSSQIISITQQNSLLSEQNSRMRDEYQCLKQQLAGLEQWLAEDIQRSRLNLVTSNIMANDINEAHQDRIRELHRYVELHTQHVNIVKLMSQINIKARVDTAQTQKYQENPVIAYDFGLLQNKNTQSKKDYKNASAQTESQSSANAYIQTDFPLKSQTIESRIKRQNIKQSFRSEVQKSHSLLSQREENKENSECHNRAPITNREKDSYKQKIMSLNELINYMMNQLKGFENGVIRKGSWFINQIDKYGSEYEERLMDPVHVAAKAKNMRYIQSLCKQDTNCQKLIKQFDSILQFYMARSAKLSSMQSDAPPVVQEKLNRTINKSRNPQQSIHIF